MRFGLWVLLALLLGAFAAHFFLADRGYVLINFRGYVVEMSVPGLVLVLLALYALIRAIATVVGAPRRMSAALADRRWRRSGADLANGLIELMLGNWARGERLLTHGARDSDTPLVNYVLAARAAHLQGAHERRDEWLKLAYDVSGPRGASVLLTQAELQLDAGDAAAAVATLQRLDPADVEQPVAIALLARAHRALGDAGGLAALLPRLGRARLTPAEREELAVVALRHVLESPDVTDEKLEAVWAALPSELRMAPTVIAVRAIGLDRVGRADDAERDLRTVLKRSWQPALVHAYGMLRSGDVAKQLEHVETWLETRPEDATLLLAAARLCMARELWGKARSYLESSLALAPVPEAYALYGTLLTALGEDARALEAFRSGLELASGTGAPAPEMRRLAPPEPSTDG